MITQAEFGWAYRTGFDLTVRFLLAKGAPKDAAEETAQAAWSRGWERVQQLRKEELLKTWINTIALNMYRRAIREDRRKEQLFDMTGGENVNFAAIDLSTLLNRCGPAEKLLLLNQMQGLTTSELARTVGATEAAVRVRLTRARQAARTLLEAA